MIEVCFIVSIGLFIGILLSLPSLIENIFCFFFKKDWYDKEMFKMNISFISICIILIIFLSYPFFLCNAVRTVTYSEPAKILIENRSCFCNGVLLNKVFLSQIKETDTFKVEMHEVNFDYSYFEFTNKYYILLDESGKEIERRLQ